MKRIKQTISAIALLVFCLTANMAMAQFEDVGQEVMVPEIEGEWKKIIDMPDLGGLNTPGVAISELAIWQAGDGSWQLWATVANTTIGGYNRLFYGWEAPPADDLLPTDGWIAKGVVFTSDTSKGELLGSVRSPYAFQDDDDKYQMIYCDHDRVCLAESEDGKKYKRVYKSNIQFMFENDLPDNLRGVSIYFDGDRYHAYYTSNPSGFAKVFSRSTKDLERWTGVYTVMYGGQAGQMEYAAENPFILEEPAGSSYYYLFASQPEKKQTSVYVSENHLDFGKDDNSYFVTHLPAIAPEIIEYEDEWYILDICPDGKGIRMAKLKWVEKTKLSSEQIEQMMDMQDNALSFGQAYFIDDDLSFNANVELTLNNNSAQNAESQIVWTNTGDWAISPKTADYKLAGGESKSFSFKASLNGEKLMPRPYATAMVPFSEEYKVEAVTELPIYRKVTAYNIEQATKEGDFLYTPGPATNLINPNQPVDGDETAVHVVWDKSSITFTFVCFESEMNWLREKVTGQDSQVEDDDHIGVAIQAGATNDQFIFFMFNPAGGNKDGLVKIKNGKMGLDYSWNKSYHISRKKEGGKWIVRITYPWDEILPAPKKGDVWRVNFIRKQYYKGYEYYYQSPSLINPNGFAYLVFE